MKKKLKKAQDGIEIKKQSSRIGYGIGANKLTEVAKGKTDEGERYKKKVTSKSPIWKDDSRSPVGASPQRNPNSSYTEKEKIKTGPMGMGVTKIKTKYDNEGNVIKSVATERKGLFGKKTKTELPTSRKGGSIKYKTSKKK